MSTAAAAGMQAALLIRGKQRLRRKRGRRGAAARASDRHPPAHVATREIAPFPTRPPFGRRAHAQMHVRIEEVEEVVPEQHCSQGRAAWEERERRALRRGSMASDEARQLRTKQTEAHHRWMRRNRVRDASAYGAGAVPGCVDPADLDPFDAYRQSAAANALLYVGLGATALGAVIFFVGTGEKGFQTVELRMIGPTLVACGLLCCLARVLLCACPVPACCARRARAKEAAAAAAAARPRWPLGDRAAAGALLAPIAAVATTAQREREEEVVTEEKPHQSPPVPPIAGIPLIHLPGDSPAAASAAPSPAPSHSSAAEAAGPPEETRACGDGDADIDSCDRQHSGVVLSPLQLEH